jgi:serine protease AprX
LIALLGRCTVAAPHRMRLDKKELRKLVEERRKADRFTQDSPVTPDVWLAFADPDVERLDLLLSPADGVDPAQLAADVRERLGEGGDAWIAYSATYAAASLSLEQLVAAVLPLSAWWGEERGWLEEVLGAIEWLRGGDAPTERSEKELRAAGRRLLQAPGRKAPEARQRKARGQAPSLKRVARNRPAYRAVALSRRTVKADAVKSLFDVDCSNIAWAIVDSGIDATHPAFRLRNQKGRPYKAPFARAGANRTRVVATYDMARLRLAHRAAEQQQTDDVEPEVARLLEAYGDELRRLRTHLLDRRPLDWDLLEPLLRVPHSPAKEGEPGYEPPRDDHGTHVAGVLAADWPEAEEGGADYPLTGICPDLRLYDIRIFGSDAEGYEFTVSAALQFIDHLNGYGRRIEIAGANVSLSVPYEMSAFGCGQTPVCQEANRLAAAGVVVVAAAGNRGREDYVLGEELVQGYRMISLTDPGNAEDVITVGSTHATDPTAYGVSHFSSRGPTADGRAKPDLVAPGEKVQGPGLARTAVTKDGTSQATPHVSGAAALLLARHRELIGKPRRVKQLLTENATDLGRERYFQGAGLVDALRAAQAC